MNSPHEFFLAKTESAVHKLFTGVSQYLALIQSGNTPVFSGAFSSEQVRDQAFESWLAQNDEAIRISLKAQRNFLNESFALGTLCGAILHVAATGTSWFSSKPNIPTEFKTVIHIGSSAHPFCIGRYIRGVPIGLIVYAGRNQYNHMDDQDLREPNRTIFDHLAKNHGYKSDAPFLDPAFDLNNTRVINFSSNMTGLLGWRSYDKYRADMSQLLGI